MKVRWTPEAEDDRAQIFDTIAVDSPRSAIKMDEMFSKAAARLADHPQYGRTGRIPGTREVVVHKGSSPNSVFRWSGPPLKPASAPCV